MIIIKASTIYHYNGWAEGGQKITIVNQLYNTINISLIYADTASSLKQKTKKTFRFEKINSPKWELNDRHDSHNHFPTFSLPAVCLLPTIFSFFSFSLLVFLFFFVYSVVARQV